MKFEVGIYHKDQASAQYPLPYCTVHRLTHNEKFMGEDFVTVSVELPVVKDPNNASRNYFMVGDWLEYRGMRYVIDVPPTIQKQARVSTKGNAITYDSVKFINQLCLDLMYIEFRDVTNGDEHYNFAARSFTFYCATLDNFAEKVKANIDRNHAGEYRVYVHATDGNNYLVGSTNTMPSGVTAVGEDNITVSISDEKCWDALAHVKEDFDVNFIVAKDEDDIPSLYIGCNGKLLSQQHFTYGKDNGLFKLERTTDDSQAIITRLRAYGAETNMPTRYYKNVNVKYYVEAGSDTIESLGVYNIVTTNPIATILNEKEIVLTSAERDALYALSGYNAYYLPTLKRSLFKNVDTNTSMATVTINDEHECVIFATVGSDTTLQTAVFMLTNDSEAIAYLEDCIANDDKIYFTGGINKGSWSVSGMIAESTNLPNNMNVKCLMLPGFGQRSLYDVVQEAFVTTRKAANIRVLKDYYDTSATNNGFDNFLAKYNLSQDLTDPWIEAAAQVAEYGMREGYAVFDDGNEDYDSIYPSLQYVNDGSNLLPAQSGTDSDGNEYGNGLRVDNGIVDDLVAAERDIPQWYLYVKNPGFNPYEQRKEGASTITVHIKDGMCGGRDFTCYAATAVTLIDGEGNAFSAYRLTLDRVDDSSLDLYFPYRSSGTNPVDYVPAEGDEIVYLDIEMPDEYVESTALYELLPAALETLDENCDVRYKFNLTIDKERMARQHYAAMHSDEEESLHDTMRAGDVLVFGDTDLGVSYNEGIAEDADTITAAILIESVEIKENESTLPEYSVTLVDQETLSSIDKMQKQIDSIVSGSISVSTTGGGGGYSAAEIQGLIKTYGGRWFLSKIREDSAAGLITFEEGLKSNSNVVVSSGNLLVGSGHAGSSSFGSGILGEGWRIHANGHGELDSLSIRKFLEVPELRYNKISIRTGVQWQTFGGGIIEEVDELDAVSGMIKLKLEEGEIGAVEINDYCMGIFHQEIDDSTGSATNVNETENVDSRNGNFKFAGFMTIYFKVTAFCDENGDVLTDEEAALSNRQYFLYELRPIDDSGDDTSWATEHHPQAAMSFACYANPTNSERQSCEYSTTEYRILLTGMTDWTYDGSNISMVIGNLNGFTIPQTDAEDKQLEGYGLAFGNAYMWGTIDQFDRPPYIVTQQLYQTALNIPLSELSADEEWYDADTYGWTTTPQTPTPSTPYLYSYWLITYDNGSVVRQGPSISGYDNSLFNLTLNKEVVSVALSNWYVDGSPTDVLEFDVEATLALGNNRCDIVSGEAISDIEGFSCESVVIADGVATFHIVISGYVSQQVGGLLAEDAFITFKCYANATNYGERTLSVIENRQGEDGDAGTNGTDAVTYSLEPSVTQFRYSSGQKFDVRCYKSEGSTKVAHRMYIIRANFDINGRFVNGAINNVYRYLDVSSTSKDVVSINFYGFESQEDAYSYFNYLIDEDTSTFNSEPLCFCTVPLAEPVITMTMSQDSVNYPIGSDRKPEEDTFSIYIKMFADSMSLDLELLTCKRLYGRTGNGITIANVDKDNKTIDFETNSLDAVTNLVQNFKVAASVSYGGKTYTIEKTLTFCAVSAGTTSLGEPGIQGCVVRLRGQWIRTEEYINESDKTSEEYRNVVRYIDVVQYTSNGTTKWYQRTTETSGYAIDGDETTYQPPTQDLYWEESNSFEFIATKLILAENAHIEFGQGNQILIVNEDGDVVGGLSGFGGSAGSYRLWIGATQPYNAPFSVTQDGALVAANVNSQFQDVSGLFSIVDEFEEDGVEVSDIRYGNPLYYEEEGGDIIEHPIKARVYNLLANNTKILLPNENEYIGQRVLVCNTVSALNISNKTNATTIVQNNHRPFFGAGVITVRWEDVNAGPAIGQLVYSDVTTIDFMSGVIELVGIPDTENLDGLGLPTCRWSVVNDGVSAKWYNDTFIYPNRTY